MSGFVAVVAPTVDPWLLGGMADAMAFRGPDGKGTWIGERIGLAWRILRTAHGASGPEPPASADEEVRIVGAVRLDNRARLKARLASDREQVSDLDLVLALYDRDGEAGLAQLRGEFAFALWDGRRQRLLCERDPFGVRPLYWATPGDAVLVGNTLEALRLHPQVSARLDDLAVADFLMFGRPWETDATVFADVRRVPAGHRLVVEGGRGRVGRYWSLPASDLADPRTVKEAPQRFLDVLQESVRERVVDESPVVFMSGGLDSTTVAALARQAVAAHPEGGTVAACTMVLDSVLHREDWRPMPSEDEAGYARSVAERIGLEHRVLDFGHAPLFERWQAGRDVPPEPIDAPHLGVLVDTTADLAANHRVALTGEGGDACLRPPADAAPHGVLDLARLLGGLRRFVAERGRLPTLSLRSRLSRKMGRARLGPPFPPWFDPDLERRLHLRERFHAWLASVPGHVDAQGRRKGDSGPRPEARRDLTSPWWPHAFWGWDSEVTRAPLEFRHPFFSPRVVEFVLSLPPVPWFWEKLLLREAAGGLLPEEVRTRPKAIDSVGSRHRLVLREGPEAMARNEEVLPVLEPYLRIPVLGRLMAAPGRLLSNEIRLITRPLTLGWWLKGLHLPTGADRAGKE